MGKTKNPQQEDQDNDGLPGNDTTQAQGRQSQDMEDDDAPDGETRLQSNPIIINR